MSRLENGVFAHHLCIVLCYVYMYEINGTDVRTNVYI